MKKKEMADIANAAVPVAVGLFQMLDRCVADNHPVGLRHLRCAASVRIDP